MLLRDGESKGLTEKDARARLASQMPLVEKLAYADVVIDNAGDAAHAHVRNSVQALLERWERDSHTLMGTLAWLVCWLLPPIGLLYGMLVAVGRTRAFRSRRALAAKAA